MRRILSVPSLTVTLFISSSEKLPSNSSTVERRYSPEWPVSVSWTEGDRIGLGTAGPRSSSPDSTVRFQGISRFISTKSNPHPTSSKVCTGARKPPLCTEYSPPLPTLSQGQLCAPSPCKPSVIRLRATSRSRVSSTLIGCPCKVPRCQTPGLASVLMTLEHYQISLSTLSRLIHSWTNPCLLSLVIQS
uniref:Uncharacterized protein n=1 Tax=Cacopsylla melanoneura TaxID=428564 RepID=A0A8D8ZY41_9HEMI